MTKYHALLLQFYVRRMKHCRIFLSRKEVCVRNFMPQEEISCHREEFPITGKMPTKEKNILRQDKMSSHRKKFTVTGRNFLLKDNIPPQNCHREKFPARGRHFLSQEETSYQKRNFISEDKFSSHRKIFPIARRHFLSQEEISFHLKKKSCHRTIFSVTGRSFLSQEVIFCDKVCS